MDEQLKSDSAKREEDVLAFWDAHEIFNKSIKKPAPKGDFAFYDGPPFATGLPHYGHLLQSAVKDAVPRYKTMQGYKVERQWGWDCHGLPIENIVEKELGISGRQDILSMGVKKFNDLCREKIFTYVDEWNKIIPRFGRWADMRTPYRTMDRDYMESEWWAFKQLYEKGLVYEGYRTMHICPRCETTLAQAEVSEGYAIIKDIAVTVAFPLLGEENTFVLAWTTTPWTLPGNVALAVGKDIAYVQVRCGEVQYVVAKKRCEYVFAGKEYTIEKEYTGEHLLGKSYTPPFDSYVHDTTLEHYENAWKIYHADFVTDEDGTGIAHEAPAFGAEDMELAKQVGLPLIQHVRLNGTIKEEVHELAGLSVKPKDDHQKTDVEVVKYLAGKKLLFAKEKYEHSYPHCWRCDTALLYYATSSWFVAVEKIKPTLLKTAEAISWSPAHIKEGRWGNWLAGARDWSISRQRFWANTMPVWRCTGCRNDVVVGSIVELTELSGVTVTDLHKDVVDEVTWPCSCGGAFTRIPDVLDTWFNSGSVPFATLHYPFQNEELFAQRVPADFIAEAQDQTRLWFYYQHVLAGGLFQKPAFKQCIVTGMVLAEDGKKMSKKLQNYPDPMYMIHTYGADAMRLYMLGSPVVQTESLRFSETEVGEIARKTIGRLVHVYEFYDLYKTKRTTENLKQGNPTHVLDAWITARVHEAHKKITNAMDNYTLDYAVRELHPLVDDVSTWYVRRSRDRIKEAGSEAIVVLQWVLQEVAKMFAPFAPFTAEWLWQRVKSEHDAESVHLAPWSSVHLPDTQVLQAMLHARNFVTIGLFARSQANIKVRQPLASFTIGKGFNAPALWNAVQDILADELNVKQVILDPTFERSGAQGGHFWLNTTITPELKTEGDAREIIRAIQDARKKSGKTPHERVSVRVSGSQAYRHALDTWKADIQKQTNAEDISFEPGNEFTVVLG